MGRSRQAFGAYMMTIGCEKYAAKQEKNVSCFLCQFEYRNREIDEPFKSHEARRRINRALKNKLIFFVSLRVT